MTVKFVLFLQPWLRIMLCLHLETVLLELSFQSQVWNSSSLCLELLFITESANCKCLVSKNMKWNVWHSYKTHSTGDTHVLVKCHVVLSVSCLLELKQISTWGETCRIIILDKNGKMSESFLQEYSVRYYVPFKWRFSDFGTSSVTVLPSL
jgi:hypothetical protein